MDCEKFDRVALDLLYDELDELTAAAARRHMDHCVRCRNIGAGLRATREVGALPRVIPSVDLTARILEAERRARARLPLGQRFGRAVSVLAGYAMRPQLAMAAVAVLMIGVSLFFVRIRPVDGESVRVTERGVPEIEHESPAGHAVDRQLPAALEGASLPVPTAELSGDLRASWGSGAAAPGVGEATASAEYGAAQAAFAAGRFTAAQQAFERIASTPGPQAVDAELMAARSSRHTQGCAVAAARFENVAARHAGTSIAQEATWQAAECRRSLGQTALAQRNYLRLRDLPAYSDRVEAALVALGGGSEPVAARARAAAKPSTASTAASQATGASSAAADGP